MDSIFNYLKELFAEKKKSNVKMSAKEPLKIILTEEQYEALAVQKRKEALAKALTNLRKQNGNIKSSSKEVR